MRRKVSRSTVWQHFTAGLILLGVGATGYVNAYREYTLYHHLNDAVDHAEWDWNVPDQWFDQASS